VDALVFLGIDDEHPFMDVDAPAGEVVLERLGEDVVSRGRLWTTSRLAGNP
jgi:hypothetical protein